MAEFTEAQLHTKSMDELQRLFYIKYLTNDFSGGGTTPDPVANTTSYGTATYGTGTYG